LPPVLHALTIVFASAEGEESSKTLFYLAGGALVLFAVVVSVLGIRRIGSFPSGTGQARGIIGVAALLVAAAMAAAIITA
jgi:hypothetical protein